MEKNEENLQDILNQVKAVDNGINGMLVPILKDTIADGNRHAGKLFVFAMFELLVILVIAITSIFVVYRQNQKYQEFLSQFDFETTVYQDTDDNSVINSGINYNK